MQCKRRVTKRGGLSELLGGGTLSGGLDMKRWAWARKGEMDRHLRRRDHQVEVHGGKGSNGLF